MSKYNIQAASKLTGVGIHTLRAWESRYGAIKPERTEKGRRLYSEQDIEKLQLLSELCQNGRTISTVANMETSELKGEISKLGINPEELSPVMGSKVQSADQIDPSDSLNKLIMALAHYKLDIISHEINKLKNALPYRDLALRVLSPLLKEVGLRVYNESMNIAQEHAISSILKFHMGHIIYQSYHSKPKRTKTMLFATPEGEFHEFGIMISSILATHYGVKYYYLGSNMPKESIFHAVDSLGIDVVVLGTTKTTNSHAKESIDNYLNYVLKKLGPKQELWVGGDGHFDLPKYQKDKRFHYISTLNFLDSYLKELT